jgi:hypothetical protein
MLICGGCLNFYVGRQRLLSSPSFHTEMWQYLKLAPYRHGRAGKEARMDGDVPDFRFLELRTPLDDSDYTVTSSAMTRLKSLRVMVQMMA